MAESNEYKPSDNNLLWFGIVVFLLLAVFIVADFSETTTTTTTITNSGNTTEEKAKVEPGFGTVYLDLIGSNLFKLLVVPLLLLLLPKTVYHSRKAYFAVKK